MSDRDAPVELSVRILHRHGDAWLIRDAAGASAWVAKQHIRCPEGESLVGDTLMILPAWVARESGLTPGRRIPGQGELFR